MLFPHRQKLEIDDTDNLHLLVDEDSAYIPGNRSRTRRRAAGSALALRTGMLRQLRPARSGTPVRRTGRRPEGRRALVIGDPPVGDDYPRLPAPPRSDRGRPHAHRRRVRRRATDLRRRRNPDHYGYRSKQRSTATPTE